MTHIKNLRGFTLIELLVVITIIGLLGTIIAAPVQSARKKGRDVKRIADLKAFQAQLDAYSQDNGGNYPGVGHYISVDGCVGLAGSTTPLLTTLFTGSVYGRLPVDPLSNATYCYSYTNTPNTVWYCVAPDGTIIDVDGINASGAVTGPRAPYMISFATELDYSSEYPRWNGLAKRYCVFGQM